jgi:hypothetical protein
MHFTTSVPSTRAHKRVFHSSVTTTINAQLRLTPPSRSPKAGAKAGLFASNLYHFGSLFVRAQEWVTSEIPIKVADIFKRD